MTFDKGMRVKVIDRTRNHTGKQLYLIGDEGVVDGRSKEYVFVYRINKKTGNQIKNVNTITQKSLCSYYR